MTIVMKLKSYRMLPIEKNPSIWGHAGEILAKPQERKIVDEAIPDKYFNNPESDRTKLFLSQIHHQ